MIDALESNAIGEHFCMRLFNPMNLFMLFAFHKSGPFKLVNRFAFVRFISSMELLSKGSIIIEEYH